MAVAMTAIIRILSLVDKDALSPSKRPPWLG
jgi:hypothetical protein